MTYVADDKVHMIVVTAEGSVQSTRPDLCVRVESPCLLADVEVQGFEVLVLVFRQAQHASVLVQRCSGGIHINIVMVYVSSKKIYSRVPERLDIPVARRIIVVPLSTIPEVILAISALPYVIDWSMPQYSLAGLDLVRDV